MAVLISVLITAPTFAQDAVIGETNISLNGQREHVRTQETNLGNMISDMLREYTGADVALNNGGGIRDSAEMGEITLEDAMSIMAFDNTVVTLEMTGMQIWRALEHGLHAYPEVAGGFLQVSGLRFYFNPDNEAYDRVERVIIGGENIDLQETYVVATNEFLAAGGDDFTMMDEAEQLETFEDTDQQMFIKYIQENTPLFPKVEGRIVVLRD